MSACHYPVYSWAFKFYMYTEVEPSALARYSVFTAFNMIVSCDFHGKHFLEAEVKAFNSIFQVTDTRRGQEVEIVFNLSTTFQNIERSSLC